MNEIFRFKIVKFILFFTIICNLFLGHPYSNMVIGPVPLNEIFLLLSLLLVFTHVGKILNTHKVLALILFWSLFFMVFRLPFDFMKHGIWAGRDATHLFEVWWLIPGIYVFERIIWEFKIVKYLRVLSCFFILKFFFFIISKNFGALISIGGVQGEIDLFGGASGVGIWLFFMLASISGGLIKSKKVIITCLLFVVLLQGRTIYLGLIFYILLFAWVNRKDGKNLRKLFSYFIIGICSLYIVSSMSFLDEYTRYGIHNIAPHKIIEHLVVSVDGADSASEELAGSAGGLNKRLGWFYLNWNKALESEDVMLLGQGFGVVLTDFVASHVVREPHNSLLSVFARTGLFGLIFWASFHFTVFIKGIRFLKIYYLNKKSVKMVLLFACMSTMIYVHIFAFFEPAFETPFSSIIIYLVIALMLVIFGRKKISYNLS